MRSVFQYLHRDIGTPSPGLDKRETSPTGAAGMCHHAVFAFFTGANVRARGRRGPAAALYCVYTYTDPGTGLLAPRGVCPDARRRTITTRLMPSHAAHGARSLFGHASWAASSWAASVPSAALPRESKLLRGHDECKRVGSSLSSRPSRPRLVGARNHGMQVS